MKRIISVIQNKGGVGKSTITSNLAAALSTHYPEKKILIVDLDAQGNQAISFGYAPASFDLTMYDVLVDDVDPNKALVKITNNFHLLPSNSDMNYFELDTLRRIKNLVPYFQLLKESLSKLNARYDYIFLDSPPELKVIFALLMHVTNEIYIPFEPDAFNAQGLISLIDKIQEFKKEYNVNPRIQGVIPVKIRMNTNLHKQVLEEVSAFCETQKIKVMNTWIYNSVKYAEFIATARMPIVWAASESKHGLIYRDLLSEVVKDGEKEQASRPVFAG